MGKHVKTISRVHVVVKGFYFNLKRPMLIRASKCSPTCIKVLNYMYRSGRFFHRFSEHIARRIFRQLASGVVGEFCGVRVVLFLVAILCCGRVVAVHDGSL
jgi:hypothetical protein